MVAPSNPENSASLMLIEGGLTVIAFAAAFALPRIGASWFARIEKSFANLARKKRLSVFLAGASAFLIRLAILPICPIPLPFVQDDFSFLLAANTFAAGHLAFQVVVPRWDKLHRVGHRPPLFLPQHHERWRDTAVRFWPQAGFPILWPPPVPLNDKGIALLRDRWKSGMAISL